MDRFSYNHGFQIFPGAAEPQRISTAPAIIILFSDLPWEQVTTASAIFTLWRDAPQSARPRAEWRWFWRPEFPLYFHMFWTCLITIKICLRCFKRMSARIVYEFFSAHIKRTMVSASSEALAMQCSLATIYIYIYIYYIYIYIVMFNFDVFKEMVRLWVTLTSMVLGSPDYVEAVTIKRLG